MKSRSTKKTSVKSFPAVLTICGLIVFMTIPLVSLAQKSWGIEFRPGLNFATKKLGDANLKTGYGFEGAISYYLVPTLSAYAGWSWNKFAANESFAGTKNDFEETGYTFGLRFTNPFENTNLSYLIEGGGIYNHMEIENTNGDIIADSKHGLGWQAGVGIVVPVGESFRLVPTVRYRALSRNITLGNIRTPVDLNYVSAGLGLAWKF